MIKGYFWFFIVLCFLLSCSKDNKPFDDSKNEDLTFVEVAVFNCDEVILWDYSENDTSRSISENGWSVIVVAETATIGVKFKNKPDDTKKVFKLKRGSKIICDNKVIRIFAVE